MQCELAHAAARTKDVQFGPVKKGQTARRGGRRAIVGVGHKILRIVFTMLRDRETHRDPDLDHDQLPAQRNQTRWVRALRKAGLLPAAEAAGQKGRSGRHLAHLCHPYLQVLYNQQVPNSKCGVWHYIRSFLAWTLPFHNQLAYTAR